MDYSELIDLCKLHNVCVRVNQFLKLPAHYRIVVYGNPINTSRFIDEVKMVTPPLYILEFKEYENEPPSGEILKLGMI